jgi:hypothetical protein
LGREFYPAYSYEEVGLRRVGVGGRGGGEGRGGGRVCVSVTAEFLSALLMPVVFWDKYHIPFGGKKLVAFSGKKGWGFDIML